MMRKLRNYVPCAQESGRHVPRQVHGFTVANPSYTLHRSKRPHPKLRERMNVSECDIDTIVRPPPP